MRGDAAPLACQLYELDGTLLATGSCRTAPAPAIGTSVIVVVDRPGRVVQRCLLGPVREVLVACACGMRRRAAVERVCFDPQHGRLCVLRMEGAACRQCVRVHRKSDGDPS